MHPPIQTGPASAPFSPQNPIHRQTATREKNPNLPCSIDLQLRRDVMVSPANRSNVPDLSRAVFREWFDVVQLDVIFAFD
jgi:hypothetical protein